MSKLGCDVSRWQGDIDWPLLASQGVLWAGIRASVGDYYTDRTFEFNYDSATDAGILPFPYHVVNANHPVEAQLARYKLSLDGRKPVMTVVDAEVIGSVSNIILRRRHVWFVRDGMRDIGGQWILYTNKNFAETHLKDGYQGWMWGEQIPLWVASYGANDGEVPPTPPYPRMPYQWDVWHAWQYTDKGKLLGGSAADIDLDLMDDGFYSNLRVRSGIPEPGDVGIPTPPPAETVSIELSLEVYAALHDALHDGTT